MSQRSTRRWWLAPAVPVAVVVLLPGSAGSSAQVAPQALPPLVAAGPNACLPGSGSRNWCGDGGPATRAKLASPTDVAVAADGSLVIADTGNNVIRFVQPDGTIGTLAGDGVVSRRPRADEPAAHPRFNRPRGVAVAADGTVLVADTGNDAIRRITHDGRVQIVLGGPREVGTALSTPEDVVALPDGGVLVAEGVGGRVLRLTAVGDVVTVASATSPVQVAPQVDGSVLIADNESKRVRRIDAFGTLSTVVMAPERTAGIAAAPDGSLLVSVPGRAGLLRLDQASGAAERVAGTGTRGFSGDAGPATSVALNQPRQLAVAADGSILFAEAGNDRIRRLAPDGRLTTVAGSDRPVGVAFVPLPAPDSDGDGGGGGPPIIGGGGGDDGGGGGGGGGRPDCLDPDPRFQIFNFVPRYTATLQTGGQRPTVRIQTSVTARVRIAVRTRDRVLHRQTVGKVSNKKVSTSVKLGVRLERGARYFVEMSGRSVSDDDLVRCDRRRVKGQG